MDPEEKKIVGNSLNSNIPLPTDRSRLPGAVHQGSNSATGSQTASPSLGSTRRRQAYTLSLPVLKVQAEYKTK